MSTDWGSFEDHPIARFLVPLFERLNTHSEAYCVLRNYLELPYAIPGTDIDFLTTQRGQQAFIGIIRDVCDVTGWSLVLHTEKDFKISHFVVADLEYDGLTPILPIDVTSIIGWHGITVLTDRDILPFAQDRDGVMVAPPDVAAAVVLVNSILFIGRIEKDKYAEQIVDAIESKSERFRTIVQTAFGVSSAERLFSTIAVDGLRRIDVWQKPARRIVSRRAWGHPFRMIADQFHRLKFGAQRVLFPPGVFLCLLGVDGSGKSTVSELIVGRLQSSFNPMVQIHLRPRWLPELRRLISWPSGRSMQSDPDSRRSPNGVISFIRWSYYWLDYFIGYHIMIRPVLAKKGIVISDRYYHDFRYDHDQKMVRLPDGLISLSQKLLSSPTVVVHVRVSAYLASIRRPGEIEIEDAERQLNQIDQIVSNLGNGHIVLNDGTPGDAADRTIRLLLRALASKIS